MASQTDSITAEDPEHALLAPPSHLQEVRQGKDGKSPSEGLS